MKKLLVLTVLILAGTFASAQEGHPWLEKQDSATRAMLEMYGASDEYLAMEDRMEEIVEEAEATERQKRNTRMIIIGVSLLAAVWTFISGIRTFRQVENRIRGGMIIAIGILMLGCGVIFAFNFGILMFRNKAPDVFNMLMAFGVVIAILVAAVLMLRKNPKKEK